MQKDDYIQEKEDKPEEPVTDEEEEVLSGDAKRSGAASFTA